MGQLWRPLAQEAWRRCHDEAREILANLSSRDLLAWLFHAAPEEAHAWVAEAGTTLPDEAAEKAAAAGAALPKATKDLLMRLYKVSDDRYLPFRELVAEAREGSSCGLALAEKNASKTSWYEDACGAFISMRCPEALVLRLAARQTKLSVRFNAAGQPLVDVSARDRKLSKDADLAVVLPAVAGISTVLLVSHKYARVSGGHQDNQMADAVKYLSFAAHDTSQPITQLRDLVRSHTGDALREITWEPALVTDGSYFADMASKGPQTHAGQRLFVGSTDDLVARVNEVLAQYRRGRRRPTDPFCGPAVPDEPTSPA